VAPPELLRRRQAADQALVTLAIRDLTSIWRTLDLADPDGATSQLLPVVRDLTDAYGAATAVVAADFYEDARAAAGVPGIYRARPAPGPPTEQVDAATRFALTPLWSRDPRYGDALRQLAGDTGRLIRAVGHDTVTRSADGDPRATGWQRITAPGACKFCVGLASRGGVYKRATVRFASHTNCKCSTSPTWDPDAREVAVEAYQASARTSRMSPEARRAHRENTRAWLNRDFPDHPG